MPPVNPRLFGALLSALLLALSFPLTLLPLPAWVLGLLPVNLPADPALGSFTIPGLPTHLGYLQFPWMAYVGLVPLLLAVRASRKSGEAFTLGFACGVVWLTLTMLWLISFGFVPVFLLALYFSLPLGLFTWLAWYLMHLPATPNVQVVRLVWGLPLLWVAIEYVRSFGMWAFPWNLLGYTQAAYPMLAQTADIGGVYLVSFLVASVNVLLVAVISNVGTVGRRAAQVSLASLLLAAAFGYGWWRDQHPGPDTKQLKSLTFELVQGGLSSREDWDDESYRKSLDAYAGTTRELLGLKPVAGSYQITQAVPALSNLPPQNPPAATANRAVTPGAVSSSVAVEPAAKPIKRQGGAPIGDVMVVWPEGALLKRGGIDLDPEGDGVPYEVRQLVEGNPQHAVLWGALGYRPTPVPAQAAVTQAPISNPGVVARPNAVSVQKPVVKQPTKPEVASPTPLVSVPPEKNGAASSVPARTFPKPVNSSTVGPQPAKPKRQAASERKKVKPKRTKRVHVMSDAERARQRRLRLVNGSILTTRDGSTWPYSKIRLVPYGEVTPFRGIVTFLRFPWDFGGVDLNAGREMKPVDWRGHKLGALICFDNLFGFIARREASAGAGYLVVMTNNSWYPMRSGIRQHADIDVLRAIETRRPLLRAATTGWSQVVERNGRIIKSSQQRVGAPDYVEATLKPGTGTTVYMAVGDLFAQLCLLGALLITLPPLMIGRSEGFL
jgi:apolipoprotein N-acyltransferase